MPAITNGIRKCSAKNRDSVASSTATPSHSHWTISYPLYGIANNKYVIIVALRMIFVLMVVHIV
jgi:hypothetical protein